MNPIRWLPAFSENLLNGISFYGLFTLFHRSFLFHNGIFHQYLFIHIIIFIKRHSRKGFQHCLHYLTVKYQNLSKLLVQWGMTWRGAKVFSDLKTWYVHREICGVIQEYVFYCHWDIEFGYFHHHFKYWKIVHDFKSQLTGKSSVHGGFSKPLGLYHITLFTCTYGSWYIPQARFWGFVGLFVFTSKELKKLCCFSIHFPHFTLVRHSSDLCTSRETRLLALPGGMHEPWLAKTVLVSSSHAFDWFKKGTGGKPLWSLWERFIYPCTESPGLF